MDRNRFESSSRAALRLSLAALAVSASLAVFRTAVFADVPKPPQAGAVLKAADLEANFAYLESLAANAVPPGTIIAFGAKVAPAGWLPCDGAAISRTASPKLFAALGTAWGAGDGTTTFNVPDLRGRFLRGFDDGTGRDPDAASRVAANPGGAVGDDVGTLEDASFAAHDHGGLTGDSTRQHGGFTDNVDWTGSGAAANAFSYAQQAGAGGPLWQHVHTIPAAGAAETRPHNAAVAWIIRAD